MSNEVEKLVEEIDINEDFADMAESIEKVIQAGEALLKSGLTRDAIVILIQQKVGVSNIRKGDIENVLWAIPRLKDYLS